MTKNRERLSKKGSIDVSASVDWVQDEGELT